MALSTQISTYCIKIKTISLNKQINMQYFFRSSLDSLRLYEFTDYHYVIRLTNRFERFVFHLLDCFYYNACLLFNLGKEIFYSLFYDRYFGCWILWNDWKSFYFFLWELPDIPKNAQQLQPDSLTLWQFRQPNSEFIYFLESLE